MFGSIFFCGYYLPQSSGEMSRGTTAETSWRNKKTILCKSVYYGKELPFNTYCIQSYSPFGQIRASDLF